MVMGTMAAAPFATPSPAQAEPGPLVCDNNKDHPYTGVYTSVTVPEGASCYLRDAVVWGNFKALHGAGDVFIIDTRVDRNIMVRGAEDKVKIGPAACRIDPIVGNNIKVTRSHNVLVCFMSTGNNITVSRNDGRISLFRNRADNNIRVINNLPYHREPGDGQHERIGAIRLRHNVAGQHIDLQNNADRALIMADNVPEPTL